MDGAVIGGRKITVQLATSNTAPAQRTSNEPRVRQGSGDRPQQAARRERESHRNPFALRGQGRRFCQLRHVAPPSRSPQPFIRNILCAAPAKVGGLRDIEHHQRFHTLGISGTCEYVLGHWQYWQRRSAGAVQGGRRRIVKEDRDVQTARPREHRVGICDSGRRFTAAVRGGRRRGTKEDRDVYSAKPL
ncbi:hypothetical protein M885DRAFT_530034 [Pelagophyceae sp. CCMP2097]|nr:hypothetical protein M885DRAFT_530034 [Pelagophyceae sp. CCMP2097]